VASIDYGLFEGCINLHKIALSITAAALANITDKADLVLEIIPSSSFDIIAIILWLYPDTSRSAML
jgi:hypothetical protein